MYIPLCDNPVLLTDKSIFYDPSARLVHDGEDLGQPSYRVIRSLAKSCTVDELQSYSVLYSNGFSKPPLFFAPCRRCPTCRKSRQNDLILRAILETESYDTPPYFFTLTYKPGTLPPCMDLSYRDVQLFFKRLRKRFSSKGLDTDFRYLVSGEYGSDPRFSHRPHYHVILWNNPYRCSEFTPWLERDLFSDILAAWDKCLPQAFHFQQVRGGAASYVTKYVQKPMYIPEGRHVKPFIHSSTGKGGLGSRFYRPLFDYYQSNPSNGQLMYTSKDGTFKHSFMSSSIFKHLHPSLSSLVPYVAKKSYKSLIDNALLLHSLGVLNTTYVDYIIHRFHPYPNYYSPQFDFSSLDYNRLKLDVCPTYRILVIYLCRRRLYHAMLRLRPFLDVDFPQHLVDAFENNRSFIQSLPTKNVGDLLVPSRFKALDKAAIQSSKVVL